MEYHRGAADEGCDLFVIADVRPLKIDRAAHLLQIRFAARQQIIDDDDPARSLGEERAHDGGADEPGSSGNDVVAHKA